MKMRKHFLRYAAAVMASVLCLVQPCAFSIASAENSDSYPIIEYMKNGRITNITSFPFNNNYDILFDNSGKAWILSSYGIYTVDKNEMLSDSITEYSLYTIENGLPYAITSNSHSALTEDGDLYIPGRNGIIRTNINNYYAERPQILTGVRSV